jgi:hypothetical protein
MSEGQVGFLLSGISMFWSLSFRHFYSSCKFRSFFSGPFSSQRRWYIFGLQLSFELFELSIAYLEVLLRSIGYSSG